MCKKKYAIGGIPKNKIHSSIPLTFLYPISHQHRTRRIRTPRLQRCIQCLNIPLPLRNIRPQHPPIISQQPINFALNIRSLGPNTTTTTPQFRLLPQLLQQFMTPVIPSFNRLVDFVRLINGVDSRLNIP